MNFKQLAITGAILSSFTAGSAFALAPDAIDPQNPGPNDLVIHWAGATAQSETITKFAQDFCADTNGNGLSEYTTFNNNPADPTHKIVSCVLKSTGLPAGVAGKNLFFTYYLNGGSFNGVGPVADQTPLAYMKPSVASCAQIVTGDRDVYNCANSGANQYLQAPQAGGSDVEAAAFKGTNVEAGFSAPSAAGLATTTQTPVYGVVFGIAAHCSLLDWTVPEYAACASSAYAAGGGQPGVIKSLSKSDITSIYTDNKAYWEQVPEWGTVADMDGNGVNDLADLYTNGFPATEIKIFRRVKGSGTQACAQAYFTRQECDPSAIAFTTAATALIPGNVAEISSSTKILTQGVDVTPYSIGISSTEKQPNVDGNSDGVADYGTNWAFVKINGVDPIPEINTATGAYDYFCEASVQRKTTALDANQAAFLNVFVAAAQDPAAIVGKPGVLASPDYVAAGDPNDVDGDGDITEYTSQNPVNWQTKKGQMCKLPTLFFP